MGKLFTQVSRTVNEQNSNSTAAEAMPALQEAVSDRLTALGETADVPKLTEALIKRFSGVQLTAEETSRISNSRNGAAVAEELAMANHPLAPTPDWLSDSFDAIPVVDPKNSRRLTETDLADYMRVGDRRHVRDTKQRIVDEGSSPILTKPEEIVGFIRDAFKRKIQKTVKAYGRVNNRLAGAVKSSTNGEISVDDYYLELDADKIAHMSDHVGQDKDIRNIPLTEEQLTQLPEYIDTYDDLIDVIRRKDGSVRLMLGKKINGHSIIVETVSKGRKSLHPVTAYQIDSEDYAKYYKTRAIDRSSTSRSANADTVDISRPAIALNTSISNPKAGVNGENASPLTQLARETVDAQYAAENGAGMDGIPSVEGKAILGDEAVEVADIADAGNGKVSVKLTDGRTVDAASLEYEDSGEAELWRVIGKYAENAEAARALLDEYRAGDLDAYKYARGVEEGFVFGKLNMSPKEMELQGSFVNLLDPAQRNMAYKQGKIAGQKKAQQTKQQQERIDSVYKQAKAALEQKGTDAGEHSVQLADGLTVEKMGKTQRPSYELAKMIAPAVKADIQIYNGGKEWGSYDPKSDTISLNINAKWSDVSMMTFTLAHELVHRAKLGSLAKYEAFADFLIQQYGEQGASVNDMVQEQLQAAEENGISMTYEEALEEVICDACQKMLVDTDAGKRLAEFGTKSEQNKSIVKQFGQWLKELLQKLRRIFRNVEPDSLAAQEFQKFDDNVKQILADMFVDMSMDAGEKLSTIKTAGMTEKITTDEGDVKHKMGLSNKENNVIDLSFNNDLSKRVSALHGTAKYKAIKEYILEVLADQPIVLSDGRKAMIDRSDAQHIANNAGSEKISHISQIKKLVETAVLYANYTNAVHNKFDQFWYYRADVRFGVEEFPLYVNVGRAKNDGSYHIYDITQNLRDTANRINGFERPKQSEGGALKNGISNKSIRNPDGKVKKISSMDSDGNQLSAGQQKYFAESEAVDRRGNLLVLYHQTAEDIAEFDPKHPGAGKSDNEVPFGIFLKRTAKDIGLKGKKQLPLYANATNPLRAESRTDLVDKLREISPEYATAYDEISEQNRVCSKQIEDAGQKINDYMIEWRQNNPDASRRAIYDDAKFNELSDAEDALIEEWVAKDEELTLKAKEIITTALTDAGYDSIFLAKDKGSFGRETDAIIVLNSNQVKSVDNKSPTDDPRIRYKLPVGEQKADRGMLVDLFEQMVTDSNEYRALQNYKKNIDQMLALEEKVDRLTEEIKRVSFAEGPRNMEYLDNLKQQRKKAVAELNRFDSILLGLEKSGVLRSMIERNRQMIQQESYRKAREYYREKNEAREAEIREYYRESRRKAVERHNQAEVRQRIRKDVQRLDSLLNKGTKEKNVKGTGPTTSAFRNIRLFNID